MEHMLHGSMSFTQVIIICASSLSPLILLLEVDADDGHHIIVSPLSLLLHTACVQGADRFSSGVEISLLLVLTTYSYFSLSFMPLASWSPSLSFQIESRASVKCVQVNALRGEATNGSTMNLR